MTLKTPDLLQQNLQALSTRDPALTERLCLPVDGSHIEIGQDQKFHYRLHLGRFPLLCPAQEVTRQVASVDGSRDVFLFGLGQGDVLSAVLDRLAAPAGRIAIDPAPGPAIIAWERDPALLRVVLSQRDYTPWLRSGRLRLSMGVDLVGLLHERDRCLVLRHPLLSRVYLNEGQLFTEGLRDRRALICDGGLFVDEVGRALREVGFSLFTLDLKKLSREELALTCQRFAPELVVAINYSYGLGALCEDQGCDLLCWEVDFATDNLPSREPGTGRAHIFTYRRAHVDEFLAAGFSHVEHLALAADTRKRAPIAQADRPADDRYAAKVAFVGISGLSQAAAYREQFVRSYAAFHGNTPQAHEAGTRVLGEVLAEQRRDFTRYVIPGLLRTRCPEFFDAAMRKPGGNPVKLAGDLAACEKRIRYLDGLGAIGPGAVVHVWGDEGWRSITGVGVVYQGLAGHHEELNRIYCGAQINIDVNRLFQPDIVTMRVFDVLACGGFLLAEHSDDLAELFRIGVDLEAYRTLDELCDKVAYFLLHPEAARAIAAQGLRTVRERHTIAQRVRYMLSRVIAVPRTPPVPGPGSPAATPRSAPAPAAAPPR